jgi:hypothetical protein
MIRRIFSTIASVLMATAVAGTVAWGAHVPYLTGPVQGGDMLGALNYLINQLNLNTGWLGVQVGPITSTATTAEQTLAQTIIPGGTLTTPGQTLVMRCGGLTASNNHTKTINLYFGQYEYSTPAISSIGAAFELEMTITAVTATANEVMFSRGSYGPPSVSGLTLAPNASNDTYDNLTGNITAKCTVTQGTASASDTTLYDFVIWREF